MMELRPLESFLAVISTGSITAAARVLGRSQPVVTRQIQEIEAEVGFELFTRNGPRIAPTEQGLRFHIEVERLMAGMKQLSERAAAIASSAPLAIEVAAIPALAAGLVPQAIAMLDQRVTPQTMHLRSSPAEQVVQSVLARNADLGVASLPLEHPGVDISRLYRSSCVVAVSAENPLAQLPSIRLVDLHGAAMIGMANPFRLRHRIDQAFSNAGVRPGRVIDTNATVTALQLVRHTRSAAIVEPVTAYGLPLEGVVIQRLDIDVPFFWGAVTPTHAPRSETIEALLSNLDEAATSLLPDVEIFHSADTERFAEALYGSKQTSEQ